MWLFYLHHFFLFFAPAFLFICSISFICGIVSNFQSNFSFTHLFYLFAAMVGHFPIGKFLRDRYTSADSFMKKDGFGCYATLYDSADIETFLCLLEKSVLSAKWPVLVLNKTPIVIAKNKQQLFCLFYFKNITSTINKESLWICCLPSFISIFKATHVVLDTWGDRGEQSSVNYPVKSPNRSPVLLRGNDLVIQFAILDRNMVSVFFAFFICSTFLYKAGCP